MPRLTALQERPRCRKSLRYSGRQRTRRSGYHCRIPGMSNSVIRKDDLLTDIRQIISELELKKAAIDRAIAALREIHMAVPEGKSTAAAVSKSTRPRISRSGRERLAEAMRQRWAAKRAAQKAATPKKVTAGRRRKRATGGKKASAKKSSSKKAAQQGLRSH